MQNILLELNYSGNQGEFDGSLQAKQRSKSQAIVNIITKNCGFVARIFSQATALLIS